MAHETEYGSYGCPKVWLLKRFTDFYLKGPAAKRRSKE